MSTAHACAVCHAPLHAEASALYPATLPPDAVAVCPYVAPPPRQRAWNDYSVESRGDCLRRLAEGPPTLDAAATPRPCVVASLAWAENGHRCDAWAFRSGERVVWLLDWHAFQRAGYQWVERPNAHESKRWGDITPDDFERARSKPLVRHADSRAGALWRIAADVYLRARDGGAGEDEAAAEGRAILRAPRADRWDEAADHRDVARAARILAAHDSLKGARANDIVTALTPLL